MICLYHGTGLIGSAIRWQTRGPYSHAAWMCRDGSAIEAWHLGGVQHSVSPFALQSAGTRMDVFSVKGISSRQMDAVEDFLREMVGCRYDWLGVVRFLSGVNRNNWDRWFCSELVAEACEFAGRPVLEAEAWKLSPSTLAWSTELRQMWSQVDVTWWESHFGRPAVDPGWRGILPA